MLRHLRHLKGRSLVSTIKFEVSHSIPDHRSEVKPIGRLTRPLMTTPMFTSTKGAIAELAFVLLLRCQRGSARRRRRSRSGQDGGHGGCRHDVRGSGCWQSIDLLQTSMVEYRLGWARTGVGTSSRTVLNVVEEEDDEPGPFLVAGQVSWTSHYHRCRWSALTDEADDGCVGDVADPNRG